MTPITIERELLERAKDALIESVDLVRHDYENDWRHGVPTRKAQLEGSRLALEAHEKVIHDISAALSAPATAPEPCKWKFDDDESNTWASGCGELWSFIDGGPAENRVKYCHGCGKPVVLEDKQ